MKEAAGEANMTVVTIVLIAIVLGAGTIIVTNMINNISSSTEDVTQSGECPNGTSWDASEQECK